MLATQASLHQYKQKVCWNVPLPEDLSHPLGPGRMENLPLATPVLGERPQLHL